MKRKIQRFSLQATVIFTFLLGLGFPAIAAPKGAKPKPKSGSGKANGGKITINLDSVEPIVLPTPDIPVEDFSDCEASPSPSPSPYPNYSPPPSPSPYPNYSPSPGKIYPPTSGDQSTSPKGSSIRIIEKEIFASLGKHWNNFCNDLVPSAQAADRVCPAYPNQKLFSFDRVMEEYEVIIRPMGRARNVNEARALLNEYLYTDIPGCPANAMACAKAPVWDMSKFQAATILSSISRPGNEGSVWDVAYSYLGIHTSAPEVTDLVMPMTQRGQIIMRANFMQDRETRDNLYAYFRDIAPGTPAQKQRLAAQRFFAVQALFQLIEWHERQHEAHQRRSRLVYEHIMNNTPFPRTVTADTRMEALGAIQASMSTERNAAITRVLTYVNHCTNNSFHASSSALDSREGILRRCISDSICPRIINGEELELPPLGAAETCSDYEWSGALVN